MGDLVNAHNSLSMLILLDEAYTLCDNSVLNPRRGGGALPIMDYTGRLRSKGGPFLGWRYQKGPSKYLEQTHPSADRGFLK